MPFQHVQLQVRHIPLRALPLTCAQSWPGDRKTVAASYLQANVRKRSAAGSLLPKSYLDKVRP